MNAASNCRRCRGEVSTHQVSLTRLVDKRLQLLGSHCGDGTLEALTMLFGAVSEVVAAGMVKRPGLMSVLSGAGS